MFALSVEKWRPLVKAHANGNPVEFLLQWISMESGGNPAALGTSTEVGLFQIDMQDGDTFGGGVQSLHGAFAAPQSQHADRALTSDEQTLQVTTGVSMVTRYADLSTSRLANIGASWSRGSSDFWSLVKLHHALPAIPSAFLPAFAAEQGHPPSGWSDFTGWLNGLSQSDVSRIHAGVGRYYGSEGHKALTRFTSNAERCGAFGGVELLGGLVTLPLLVVLVLGVGLATMGIA